jgi:hypothetical protein
MIINQGSVTLVDCSDEVVNFDHLDKVTQAKLSFMFLRNRSASPAIAAVAVLRPRNHCSTPPASLHLQNLFPHPTGKRLHMFKRRMALRHVEPVTEGAGHFDIRELR